MQYWNWLTQAAQGNLGRSYFTQIPVAQSIAQRLPVDLSIACWPGRGPRSSAGRPGRWPRSGAAAGSTAR